MRGQASYSKTIVDWTSELDIVGRLLFCDKLIIALMQGSASAIKVNSATDMGVVCTILLTPNCTYVTYFQLVFYVVIPLGNNPATSGNKPHY